MSLKACVNYKLAMKDWKNKNDENNSWGIDDRGNNCVKRATKDLNIYQMWQ